MDSLIESGNDIKNIGFAQQFTAAFVLFLGKDHLFVSSSLTKTKRVNEGKDSSLTGSSTMPGLVICFSCP